MLTTLAFIAGIIVGICLTAAGIAIGLGIAAEEPSETPWEDD